MLVVLVDHRRRHPPRAVLRRRPGCGNNVLTILQLASAIGVVTVGMTFVIIGGGIDLSVGAIIALAGVWSTTLATQSYGTGGMIFTAIAVGVGGRRWSTGCSSRTAGWCRSSPPWR